MKKMLFIYNPKAGKAQIRNKLADILNVNANLITRWRNKERIPSLTSIQPLIDFLGVQWTYPGTLPFGQNTPEIRRVSSHAPTEKVQGKNLQELSVYDSEGKNLTMAG